MAQDLDSAHKFLERFAESWAEGDGQRLADQFTEDGSLINPFGERADGRSAVAAMYTHYLGGLLAGTTSTISVETVRPVGEAAAVVDADQIIAAPDGAVVMAVHLTALLRRDGEEWRFVDARPYIVATLPN